MRTIFISVILIGLLEVISGGKVNSSEINESGLAGKEIKPAITAAPRFTEIGESLFVAITSGQDLNLNEGTIIEFNFRRMGSLKSFHVNDANQDVIDQGEADLLVMIHQDLALALKSDKLTTLKVTDGDSEYNFIVDAYWQPHAHLSSLR